MIEVVRSIFSVSTISVSAPSKTMVDVAILVTKNSRIAPCQKEIYPINNNNQCKYWKQFQLEYVPVQPWITNTVVKRRSTTTTTNSTDATSTNTAIKTADSSIMAAATMTTKKTTNDGTTTSTGNNNNNNIYWYRWFVDSFIQWYTLRLQTHPYIIKGLTSGIIAASGDVMCQYYLQNTSSPITTKTIIHPSDDNVNDDKNSPYNTITTTTTTTDEVETPAPPPKQHQSESFVSWWDYSRTIRFGLLGAFYVAPGCHLWYNQLAVWFPIVIHRAAATSTAIAAATTAVSQMTRNFQKLGPVVQRVVLDQFAFTPIFLIGWLTLKSNLESGMSSTTTVVDTSKSTMMMADTETPTTLLHNWYRTTFIETPVVQILYSNWMVWIPVQLCNFYFVSLQYQVLASNCVSLIWNMYLSYMTTTTTTASITTTNQKVNEKM